MTPTEEQMAEEVLKWFDEAPVAAQIVFKNSSVKELHDYHHSLGQYIRNTFKLWENQWTPELIDGVDYSPGHPDAISMRIIRTVWEKFKMYSTIGINSNDVPSPSTSFSGIPHLPHTKFENKWEAHKSKSDHRVFLDSTGFDEFDVRMYINGNFGGQEETFHYAKRIADAMNLAEIFP